MDEEDNDDIRTPPLTAVAVAVADLVAPPAAAQDNLVEVEEEGNTIITDDDDFRADLKLHGVNPKVALVLAAVLAAKFVMERNAFLDGVANVANVLEIPPSVRTATAVEVVG